MKVIDLAIGFSKGIIPPKIKYKGFIYEYLKDIKDYIRLEDKHIKTLQINVEQFNDEVEIVENIEIEDAQKDVLGGYPLKEEDKIVSALPDPLKIEKDSVDYYIFDENNKKYYLTTNNRITISKINQVIDYLKKIAK